MLGFKLKQYRKEKGLTQEQFSRQIEISRSYLGDLESGRKLGNINTLKKIAKGTNTPLTDWIYNDNNLEKDYNKYELLDSYIDNLIESGFINTETGEIDKTCIPGVIRILEGEILLKIRKED